MKILYIEPHEVMRDIYCMELEASFNATLNLLSSESEAVDALEKDKDYNVVIIDSETFHMGAGPLYRKIKDLGNPFPVLLMSESAATEKMKLKEFLDANEGNAHLGKSIDAEEFRNKILESLKSDPESPNWVRRAEDGFISIKSPTFLRFKKVPCDIFIRINDQKFVKLVNKEDDFLSDVVEKYKNKGVERLYVKHLEYPNLANLGTKLLLDMYKKEPKGEKAVEVQIASLEDMHQTIIDLGINEETAELAKKTVEASKNMVKKSRSVANLLNKMKRSGNYIYDHSLRLSYITVAIAQSSEYKNEQTITKLSLASMMHDMTLVDPEIAKAQTSDDPILKGLNDAQREDYLQHPLTAAEHINQKKEFPPDVDSIVAQHHERPDGSGFPRGLSKLRISPLSCIFIIGHEFVRLIDEYGGDLNAENRDKAIAQLDDGMYRMGNFKKPFAGLCKAFGAEK